MRVAFRVDASLAIGTGHVMRCFTLADWLAREGAHCLFICREHPGHLADWIQQKGFVCYRLPQPTNAGLVQQGALAHAPWLGASWQEDAQQTLAVLDQPVDWLVVDHYAIDADWQAQVAPAYKRLLVIDDLADRDHVAHLLLDQTWGRQALDYGSRVPKDCSLLLGSRYALLRPEFAQWREQSLTARGKRSGVNTILISMGGVDADNMTARVLALLNELDVAASLAITVVLGNQAPHLDAVTNLASQMRFPTQVLTNVAHMAELMANADLAIGAAGSTTWERACLGLPSLLFCLADNQRSSIEAVAKQGAAWFIRDMSQLAHVLALLIAMPERLTQMQALASQLTDGNGVFRVARMMWQAQLQLKPVVLTDSERLFAWRNHPAIRAVSLQQDALQFEAHHQWLTSSLLNEHRLMWMAYCADEPVGMIRFDRNHALSQEAEVSLYLAPEKKGQGLGKQLLAMGEQAMMRQWSLIQQIRAQVLANNEASIHLFTQAHYQASTHVFYKQVTHETIHSH